MRQAGAGQRPGRAHERRSGLRRFRRRPDGPGPLQSRHPGPARSGVVHPAAVAAERGRDAVRPDGGRRAVAVRAPGDPAPSTGSRSRAQPGAQVRRGGRVLAGGAQRGRLAGGCGRPRQPDSAVLRRPGAHPDAAPPGGGVEEPRCDGLGQLRQRPRRRQRAVRAELAVLRRPDHRRPADLVPADGAHPWPSATAATPRSCPSRSPTRPATGCTRT